MITKTGHSYECPVAATILKRDDQRRQTHEENKRMTMRIIMPIIPVTAFLTALPPFPY